MGKVRAPVYGDIATELHADNPRARRVDIDIFADALRTYHEAAANILKHGSIVAHPRTGAPIENPYLKVRDSAARGIAKQSRIASDRVLALMKSGEILP